MRTCSPGSPERFTVVAVQDHLAERRTEAEQRFGCRSYVEFDDLLADDEVELVVIAVPSHLHTPYAIAALQAGRHVVGEKPMATSLAEAQRMVEVRDATGRLLSVFQNWRFRPELQKLLAIVGAGLLGRVVQARLCNHGFGRRWDWQTLRRFGRRIAQQHRRPPDRRRPDPVRIRRAPGALRERPACRPLATRRTT